jgi:hypothetical protein
MEKVERAKAADTKLAPVQPTAEEIAKAAALLTLVENIPNKADLKKIHDDNKTLMNIRVNNTTLLDAINKRVAQLA